MLEYRNLSNKITVSALRGHLIKTRLSWSPLGRVGDQDQEQRGAWLCGWLAASQFPSQLNDAACRKITKPADW